MAALDGDRITAHDLCNGCGADVNAAVQHAAQVAVGEDSGEHALRIQHRGHAQTLARHFQQRLGQTGGHRHFRQALAVMHDIIHRQQQAPAQCSARMRQGKILSGKAACFQKGDGEGVAHGQRCGGA